MGRDFAAKEKSLEGKEKKKSGGDVGGARMIVPSPGDEHPKPAMRGWAGDRAKRCRHGLGREGAVGGPRGAAAGGDWDGEGDGDGEPGWPRVSLLLPAGSL